MSEEEVDLFVIGGGSGGVRAARVAAQHGAKVMLAEAHRLGGTCVIRGCVPKKLYVYASRFADAFADAAGFGWSVEAPSFDFATLHANKDREIARLEALYENNLRRAGVALFAGRATVRGAHRVALADGREVSARTILVATGGHPFRPEEMPGIHLADSSNDVFEWRSLPASVALVGGGYVGVEFACLLHRLGCAVTLVLRDELVLPRFDEDLRRALTHAMRATGITVLSGTSVASLSGERGAIELETHDGQRRIAERVVFATGRRPHTAGLGLLEAGVALDPAGGVVVDGFSQSSVPSIYAVGDVTNRAQLTPVAIREGQAFADSVFGGRPTRVDIEPIPTAVFATPEVGTVGLTEAAARARHDEVVIYKSEFRAMKATLSNSSERTLMKLVVDRASDRVLGVHILGESAGEMIQLIAVAVRMGATKRELDSTLAVHPTAAEELVTMRTPWSPPAS